MTVAQTAAPDVNDFLAGFIVFTIVVHSVLTALIPKRKRWPRNRHS